MTSPLVWYAAYGSNLSRERLECYVHGGRPRGSQRSYEGCRDRSPPRDWRALELPLEVYFARRSRVWHGCGVAFVAPTGSGLGRSPTRCRAWLVTLDQLGDIARQENHAVHLPTPDLGHVLEHGEQVLGSGWYGRVLLCRRELEGHPVLTLTAPDSEREPPRTPAPAYVRTIVAGLRESHGLDAAAAAAWLATVPGLRGAVAPEEVGRWCALDEGDDFGSP